VVVAERGAGDGGVPRPRRVVVGRSVREPRRAGDGGHAGARGGCAAASAGAHAAELEEPRVRDHVGQPELVPPHKVRSGDTLQEQGNEPPLVCCDAGANLSWIASCLAWLALHEVQGAQGRQRRKKDGRDGEERRVGRAEKGAQ
jgi:hypothetical protein